MTSRIVCLALTESMSTKIVRDTDLPDFVRIMVQFDLERYGNSPVLLFSNAVPVPASDLQPRSSGPLRAPARCISRKGDSVKARRVPPLQEMTSAAYGAGKHSVANALAAGVPLFPFSATPPLFRSSALGKWEKSGTSRLGVLGAFGCRGFTADSVLLLPSFLLLPE